MIEYRKGNILTSDTNFIVCPVNCMGTMGAGLAKQFAHYYPTLERRYKADLKDGALHTRKVDMLWADDTGFDRNIILFVTKWDWREPSEYRWILWSLLDLKKEMERYVELGLDLELGEPSIAFPKIGCGLGGLDWYLVKEELEWFDRVTPAKVRVVVYE